MGAGGKGLAVGVLLVALAAAPSARADQSGAWRRGPIQIPPVGQRAAGPASFFASTRPRPDVLSLALTAYRCGRRQGAIDKPLLTLIDYSLPADVPRLWVIDVDRGVVLFHELVAHGRGSGVEMAVSFSNEPGSLQSSLGLFRTAETYEGRHGHSLNLVGLEPGINDRAYERRIVMHGAAYVTPEFVAEHGRLGRSWGCPALDPRISRRVIERIKEGSAVFAYYPDSHWLDLSRYRSCDLIDAGIATSRAPTDG